MKAPSCSPGHRLGAALALGGAACLWPSLARGDDAAELAGLLAEPVVSAASKSAETASDAPATTSVLTAADMRRYGIRSLAEAIDFLGMGLVTQDPLHSVEIGSRGVLITGDYGAHVLVLVDGHALNEPWNGTAYLEQGLGVPLELIDHVELVLGPGSVLYGGNAMLGVINVVTKKVGTYRGLTLVAEGGLSPEHGRGGRLTSFMPGDLGTTHRVGVGIGKSFRVFGEEASFLASAEVYGQNGPSFEFPVQGGNTNAFGAPYDYGPRAPGLGAWGGRVHEQYYTSVPTVWGKLSIGDLTLSARATQYDRATPYINYFNQLASDFDERRSLESERWFSLDARYHRHVGERLELVAHAYADSYRYQQLAYNSEPTQCEPATSPCLVVPRPRSRWAGVELQGTIDWLNDDSFTTLLGADVRVRDVRARIDVDLPNDGPTVFSSTLGNATEVPWAVYVQQRYSPVRRAHLNAGARLDSDPRGGERISPRAAFAVEPWGGGVVKGIYAEAFRAPSYFESVFRPSSDTSTGQLGGITELRPETVRGVEASVEQRFGGQRLSMGVYRTWWKDMISLSIVDPATGSLAYQNGSTITNYGFNSRFEGTSGDWAYGASVTGGYARRNLDGGSVKLPVAPHLFGNARASYDLPGSWPVLALATSFVSSRLADRANDGGFPRVPVAPFSLTLRATASGDVGLLEGLSYRLAFNYVTAASSPYVAGPVQQGDPTDPDGPLPALAPVNRLLGFATLTYNLPL